MLQNSNSKLLTAEVEKKIIFIFIINFIIYASRKNDIIIYLKHKFFDILFFIYDKI